MQQHKIYGYTRTVLEKFLTEIYKSEMSTSNFYECHHKTEAFLFSYIGKNKLPLLYQTSLLCYDKVHLVYSCVHYHKMAGWHSSHRYTMNIFFRVVLLQLPAHIQPSLVNFHWE